MSKNKIAWIALFAVLTSQSAVAATEISNLPIQAAIAAKPNMIFLLDDSGSMNYEVLLGTNDGSLWWDSRSQSFTDATGKLYFNNSGKTGSDGSYYWYKYTYLFPTASLLGGSQATIPPTPAYAFMRSSDYNPQYYNPNINYTPWESAYINGSTITFGNADPNAARLHPALPLTGTPETIDLTQEVANESVYMRSGMTIPGATIPNITARRSFFSQWQNITSDYLIPDNENWYVRIPYYPATYYLKDSTCTIGPDCFTSPDGQNFRRYEIKPGNSFPSGRSYTDEMQNFANWFTYYRKRKLMLSSSMGIVLSQIKDIRGGITYFNNNTPVSMFDFSKKNDSENAKSLLGLIYTSPSNGTTPTREALKYVGDQFRTNNNIIEYGCQINATMVLTDGYAIASGPSAPSYNQSLWGAGSPYTQIYDDSLADLALAYYTNNLRPDLPTNLVPIDPNPSAPNADTNDNLHMNTYALTIGTKGTIFGTGTPQAIDPFKNPPVWPNPNVTRSPTAVDDLWHATINGRGTMFKSTDPLSTVASIQDIISSFLIKAGAGAAVGVATNNLSSSNNTLYLASYNSRYGEISPVTIDLSSGNVNNNPKWSAQAELDKLTSAERKIATYNGSQGIPFQWAGLPLNMQQKLNTPLSPPGPNDGNKTLDWIRGDKSFEGSLYRSRLHLLGDLVNAEPVYVQGAQANYIEPGYSAFKTSITSRTPMVYQGANDGMLHAFYANTGQEAWAYVPRLVFDNLNKLASKVYNHLFYVDGTPSVGDVKTSNGWRTLLVGGLNAGGRGFYALDITQPTAGNETSLAASKVLWEFPNASTPLSVNNNVGLSFGKPILSKTKAAGWVVLVTSGYNNDAGDSKGHLFVLDPDTGAVIKDIVTSSGTAQNPSGLAQISAFAENREYDPTIDSVYGGDLNGNLWKFDLSGDTVASWKVVKLAQLVDASGAPQAITAAPELAEIDKRRMIYVGTGKLLGVSDLSNTQTQTMYALVDDMTSAPTIYPLRANLVKREISNNNGTTIDYSSVKGWYIDFPDAGERVTTTPALAFGALMFTTNKPSAQACASTSYVYMVDSTTGMQLPDSAFGQTTPWVRKQLGAFLTTRPVLVQLPSGQVNAIIHNADNSTTTFEVPNSSASQVKEIAWSELLLK